MSMETLDLLRARVDAIEELQSIVRTMKALSTASIRQYEHAAAALAHYNRTVRLGLHVALRDRPAAPGPHHRHEHVGAVVVFGSDHGLCGRFNEVVTDHALHELERLGLSPGRRHLLVVGARAALRLEALGHAVDADFQLPGSAPGITATVGTILVTIEEWRRARGVTRVLLCHNRRTATAPAVPRTVELLPVDLRRFHTLVERRWPSRALPTFTMEPDRLLSSLIRQFLFVSVFRACAESMSSEHASRLVSMQAAERNIAERLEEMSAELRRRRQEAITAEIRDILSGFETQRST
jgi:F-type H+-transporting ATPase subunit gamma